MAKNDRTGGTSGQTAAPKTVRAFVGLGANVGDARGTLTAAVHALAALPGTRLVAVSRLYVTVPVEVADQPRFHNAVAALEVPAGPDAATGATALLIALKGIERAFGRQERYRYGPRELDLDLLLFGDARLSIERPPQGESIDPAKAGRLLVVPHEEARRRLFVLAPLADIAPDLEPPGWGESVADARSRQVGIEGAAAVEPVGDWDRQTGRWH